MRDILTISHQTLSGEQRLEGCRIVDCRLENGLDLTNCLLEHCDLSNLKAERCGIHGIKFVDCRLTGASFAECDFRDVTFTDCAARYLNCFGASFRNCLFERCDCREGVFAQTGWRRSRIEECVLMGADCSQLTADRLDLSDSMIEGALFSPERLKGIVVSSLQAVSLAKMLGLEVK